MGGQAASKHVKPSAQTHQEMKILISLAHKGKITKTNYKDLITDSVVRWYIMGLTPAGQSLFFRAGRIAYNPKGMTRPMRQRFETAHSAFLELFSGPGNMEIPSLCCPYMGCLDNKPRMHRPLGYDLNPGQGHGILITMQPARVDERAKRHLFSKKGDERRRMDFCKLALYLLLNKQNVESMQWEKYLVCLNNGDHHIHPTSEYDADARHENPAYSIHIERVEKRVEELSDADDEVEDKASGKMNINESGEADGDTDHGLEPVNSEYRNTLDLPVPSSTCSTLGSQWSFIDTPKEV